MDPIELGRKIRAAYPPCSLGRWPTPVEPRQNLAAASGREHLWLKREDHSAHAYGGNKIRGLEFLLAGLPAGTVCVTIGGLGSTHCLATATYARALGLRSVVAQFPQPETAACREVAAACAARVDLAVRSGSHGTFPFALWRAWRSAGRLGPRHWIPGGGASPRAVLGHLLAGLELAAQVPAAPDAVVVPLGSGSSAAGLVLAMIALEWPTIVVAVRVAPALVANRWRVRHLAASAGRLIRPLGVTLAVRHSALRIQDGLGRGYGYPTPGGAAAAELAARHGIHLDPTYGAKAFAGLCSLPASFRRVVFWHTFAAP